MAESFHEAALRLLNEFYSPADIWQMYRDRKEWQRMDDIWANLMDLFDDCEVGHLYGECQCKRNR